MADNEKSATRATLEAIHSQLAEAITTRVAAAAADPEKALAASEITAIAKFLSDNDVKASDDDRAKLKAAAESFPFPVLDDDEPLPSESFNRR